MILIRYGRYWWREGTEMECIPKYFGDLALWLQYFAVLCGYVIFWICCIWILMFLYVSLRYKISFNHLIISFTWQILSHFLNFSVFFFLYLIYFLYIFYCKYYLYFCLNTSTCYQWNIWKVKKMKTYLCNITKSWK